MRWIFSGSVAWPVYIIFWSGSHSSLGPLWIYVGAVYRFMLVEYLSQVHKLKKNSLCSHTMHLSSSRLGGNNIALTAFCVPVAVSIALVALVTESVTITVKEGQCTQRHRKRYTPFIICLLWHHMHSSLFFWDVIFARTSMSPWRQCSSCRSPKNQWENMGSRRKLAPTRIFGSESNFSGVASGQTPWSDVDIHEEERCKGQQKDWTSKCM